jgi:drug/metabolite transporter (DMT)-like permease
LQSLRTWGIILVLVGASFWGASGTAVQFLYEYKHLTPDWIFTIRNTIAGLLFLLYVYARKGKLFAIWHEPKDIKSMLVFCWLGLLPSQYSYLRAIEASNAATATVLQYLMPIIILGYVLWSTKKVPDKVEVIAVFLAVAGTYLLVTKGHGNNLEISSATLFWGLLSAVTGAVYTISPYRLIGKYSAPIVLGWGMFINGIIAAIVLRPWPFTGIMDMGTIGGLIVFILFGSVLAFYCYLESTQYIASQEVSALSSVEPLASVILAVGLLHVKLNFAEIIGMLFIISTVVILARRK